MMATIGQLMTNTPIGISRDANVKQATQKMLKEGIGALLVEKDEQFVGILTETDVVRKAAAKGRDLSTTPVHEIMSSPVLSIDMHVSARYAIDIMANAEVRHLAVTDGGKIVGLISVRDILDYFKTVIPPGEKN